jgi:AcrR family transcriptional regulator
MEIKKKQRRKKKELDEIIWNSFEKLVIERGFNAITIACLAKEAKVELPVLYKRFEDMDGILKQYVRKYIYGVDYSDVTNYDFWLTKPRIDQAITPKENLKKVLTELIEELYDNPIMQRVLVWEINETHRETRRMSFSREVDSYSLLQHIGAKLDNIYGVGSLMVAGIYYLILHRKISSFCTINYNTPQGKRILIETVESMIDKIYSEDAISIDDKMKEVAKKLLEKGVDKNIVKESTGLLTEEIDKLVVK